MLFLWKDAAVRRVAGLRAEGEARDVQAMLAEASVAVQASENAAGGEAVTHYRVSVEFERSLFFAADYFTATERQAEEQHVAELWRKYGRRMEPEDCETVVIPPRPDEVEGVPS